MRSMMSGVLGFGLVAIPVDVYKAMDPDTEPLHWVHRACGQRIHYVKTCPLCGVVDPEDLVQAASLADGRLVPVEAGRGAPDARDRTLALVSFHALSELDPVYFNQAYWLKPGRGAVKPYRLLWSALQDTSRVGLLRMRLRTREQLGVVRPYPTGALLLHSMHYPEDLRVEGERFGDGPTPPVTERERDMARTLVQQMAEPFLPEQYPNEPKAALWARIRDSVDQALPTAPAVSPAVSDLMRELEASVAALGQRHGAE